jgi:hypothetical protein
VSGAIAVEAVTVYLIDDIESVSILKAIGVNGTSLIKRAGKWILLGGIRSSNAR